MKTIGLAEAFKRAREHSCTQGDWQEAECVLLSHRFCPACAEDGRRVRLLKYEPLPDERRGGRTCPVCEFFWTLAQAPVIPECELEPDYGGAFDGFTVSSDADSGL